MTANRNNKLSGKLADQVADGIKIRKIATNLGVYVRFKRGGHKLLLPALQVTDRKKLLLLLVENGLAVSGKKAQDALIDSVNLALAGSVRGRLKLFPRPGFLDGDYAFRDASAAANPRREIKARCTFEPVGGATAGNLKDLTELLQVLEGQTLAKAAVAGVCAAPLVRYSGLESNPTFNVYGDQLLGKTLLLRLIEALGGDPHASVAVPKLRDVVGQLDEMMSAANDGVLISDNADQHTESSGTRANPVRASVTVLGKLASGRITGGDRARYFRFAARVRTH